LVTERVLEFTGVQHQPHMQLLLDYRDVAGRTYSTSITLDLQQRRAYDVRLFEGASTHHGDSVYPQPGLRDVTPKDGRSGSASEMPGMPSPGASRLWP
jgi:hypothetical protein